MTTSAICMTARLTQCTKSSSRRTPPHLLPVPMTTSDRIPCLKANLPSIRTVIHIRQRPCPAPVYPADSSSAHVQHMLRPHQQTGRRDKLEAAQRYPSDAEVASDEESLNVDIIYGDCTRSCTCGRCAQRGDLFSQDARNPYPTPPKHPGRYKILPVRPFSTSCYTSHETNPISYLLFLPLLRLFLLGFESGYSRLECLRSACFDFFLEGDARLPRLPRLPHL